MSPEQLSGKEVDHRTDIWSLGILLYEMLTGELPFKGEYEQAIIYSILNEETKSLESIPAELQSVIGKALCKNPDERYQKIEELSNELRQIKDYVNHRLNDKPTPTKIWQFIKNNSAVVLIPIIVIVAVIAIIYFTQTKSTRETTAVKRLVVLPFENLGDSEDEYFSDGISDEITARLSNISEIAVIARSSAMQYKKRRKNIEEIGSDLDVDYILDGTVRWQHSSNGKSMIRITPPINSRI